MQIMSLFLQLEKKNDSVEMWHKDDLAGKVKMQYL